MADTMPKARQSEQVGNLDSIRPTTVKADLRRTAESDAWQETPIGTVVAKAVVTHYGTVKEAAYALGQVDPSLMMREFHAGRLGRLDQHGDARAKAAVAHAMVKAFPPPDPDAIAHQLIRETRHRLDALEETIRERRR